LFIFAATKSTLTSDIFTESLFDAVRTKQSKIVDWLLKNTNADPTDRSHTLIRSVFFVDKERKKKKHE